MSFKDNIVMDSMVSNQSSNLVSSRQTNTPCYVKHYDYYVQFEQPNDHGETLLDICSKKSECQSYKTLQNLSQAGFSIIDEKQARSQF